MKAMSEVLTLILARSETTSSLLTGTQDAYRYGDITKEEEVCADRMIKDWVKKCDDSIFDNFQIKRQSFKQFIKECKANESMRAR